MACLVLDRVMLGNIGEKVEGNDMAGVEATLGLVQSVGKQSDCSPFVSP